ncbi:MAG: ABC transporter ATP-binding protein [Rhodobacteraceae bacterium]|nr:ABC transporter ATP-binding protein [Paracoccaceae bacterium]MCY4250899.1 ABC transporter ATP-binding protein [Paracoccaceae bacterium]
MKTVARLELKGISRKLGGKRILEDVSLTLDAGELTCLLGPSGCGKTTTLRIIAGVDRQDTGEVLIDGRAVSSKTVNVPPEKRSVGLLFQDFALFPHLTVEENVAFGLIGRGSNRKDRITELLHRVNLEPLRKKFPHHLSGGEQQRVALARALAPKPRIMLLDEPFSNLDDRLRDYVREETINILMEEKVAVLLITHEPSEAMRMADEIVLMKKGRIVQTGSPYDLYNFPRNRDVASFFSDLNVIHGVVENSEINTPFGKFSTPEFKDRADVEVIIRPQHIRIDFDRKGREPVPTAEDGVPVPVTVAKSRYMGNTSLVEFRMENGQSMLKASVPSVFLPKPGARMWLSLKRSRCFLFPCITQTRLTDPYRYKKDDGSLHNNSPPLLESSEGD